MTTIDPKTRKLVDRYMGASEHQRARAHELVLEDMYRWRATEWVRWIEKVLGGYGTIRLVRPPGITRPFRKKLDDNGRDLPRTVLRLYCRLGRKAWKHSCRPN